MHEVQRDLSEVLLGVAQTLTANLDLSAVLPTILDQLANLVNYDSASILLLEGDLLRPVAQRSVFAINIAPFAIYPRDLAHVQTALTTRHPVLIADTACDARWLQRPGSTTIRCWLGVPLIANDQVVGMLNISHHTPEHFDGISVQTAGAFAAFAAIALNNAALHQRLHDELVERARIEAELRQERALLTERVAEQTLVLRTANQEMAQASRMKDEFLAAMSHELNTPLNTIINMTDILLEGAYGDVNDWQRRALGTVSASSKHLLSLIHDVLDVARIESGKLHLIMHTVDVDSLCRICLAQISAEHTKQNITYTIAPEITTVTADERRLRQILINLLSNAVKFTPKGGAIGLDVQHDEKRNCLKLTVWDTGIGIDDDDLQRLFRPFVQLDASLNRRFEGTGLGLTIVHRLIALHGGSLSVESRKGEGSQFSVRLPYQAVWEDDGDVASPPLCEHAPVVLVLSGMERSSARLVADLRAAGYCVEVLLQIADGWPVAQRPDLILINSSALTYNILPTLRSIRKSELLNHAPIIVLSALHLPGDRATVLAAGATVYEVAPYSNEEFANMVALCHA